MRCVWRSRREHARVSWALRSLIDRGLVAADPAQRVMAVRDHFFALSQSASRVGVFSAGRIYMVTWLSERVSADLRDAVYAHLVRRARQFFGLPRPVRSSRA